MRVLSYQILAEGHGTWISQQLGGVVDVATVAAAISFFAPIVVAWITKREASDRVKAVVNLLSVAVASVVALVWNGTSDGTPLSWQLVASTFLSGLIASVVAYKGAWKPLEVTGKIASATKNFGVGTPVPSVIETARPADGGIKE